MEKKSESKTQPSDEINLKHRVTGAGVLIFFGVLVLPWLLGPPSEAQKNIGMVPAVSDDVRSPLRSTFEDEVLAELEGAEAAYEEPEESVYVSKITPVGKASGKPEKVTKLSESETSESSSDKSMVEGGEGQRSSLPKLPASDDLKSKAAVKASDIVKATKRETQKTSKGSVGTIVPESQKKKASASDANKSNTPIKTKPSAETNVVEVGWVVQVELLTDKNGASRLVGDLKGKGFNPQTTIVDTNRGKKTGTRIWLGPFESRSRAGSENERLASRMGKRGFIRVYP